MKCLPILYDRKEECCGCTACYAICPEEAIVMVEDEEGFEYPQVDENKCVRCYMCLKVCPFKASITVTTHKRLETQRQKGGIIEIRKSGRKKK